MTAQTSPSDLRYQAQLAQAGADYVLASELWQQLVDQGSTSAMDYYNLGLTLHHQLELGKAIAAYGNATRLDPQLGSAYLNEGLAWMEIKRYDKAIQLFRQTLAVPNQVAEPEATHTLAHYNLAIIFTREENVEVARQEAQKALDLSPDFSHAQLLLEQLNSPQEAENPQE